MADPGMLAVFADEHTKVRAGLAMQHPLTASFTSFLALSNPSSIPLEHL